ncbi:hypothetical protein [Paenarthrobacter ilicis]|uniref:hypothetical protein n=1 Tax=Paenarthrobacter ilicis TaxID=43665 RepID=UPI0028D3E0EE|nr:hypothetical protein [Paenarthrobacter ilicis]
MNAAFEQWPKLSDRAFRVLVYMAKEARDEGIPVYWGGWGKLATEALGKCLPERSPGMSEAEFEQATRSAVKSQQEIVRRAVAELVRAGAIRPEGRGRTGSNARYALVMDPDKSNET